MSAMLREAGLLKELAEAKERIRQLEADNTAAVVELACKLRKIKRLEAERGQKHCRTITGGRWHHGNGILCMGTLRIAREDFDTNPVEEVKVRIFDEVCAVMNSAPVQEKV